MVLSAISGRLWLYSHVVLCFTGWAASSLWRILRCQPHHPLGWPVDQALNVALLRTLFTAGEYQHWRSFMAVWAVLNPKEREGLAFERVPSAALGHSDGRDSWWIRLSQQQQQQHSSSNEQQQPRASCVLLYIHGGGFLAGGPRMYCPAMRLWLEQLAALGVSARILSLGYPLAPEHPYPAALHFVADACRWLQGQVAPGEQVIMGASRSGAAGAVRETWGRCHCAAEFGWGPDLT
jgi:acetyl esterase/lipase